LLVLSYPALAPGGVLILINRVKANEFREHLLKQGMSFGLENMGPDTLEVLRIEAGIPVAGVDIDGDTLPLELPLEDAISFTKGCYMGQETTARMKNFGHANRKLVGLKLTKSIPVHSDLVFEGKSIGKITSIVESPRLHAYLALGMIRQEQDRSGTRIFAAEGGEKFPVEVISFPLPE
jgi:folate-binding protein YgfZ